MKKMLISFLGLLLVVLFALPALAAKDKPVTGRGDPVLSYLRLDSELEPNDSCGTANGPLLIGDAVSAAITPADQDWFSFQATGGQCVRFQTQQVAGQPLVDTIMGVIASNCSTVLADDDDGGANYYSLIEFTFPSDGTYYVIVLGYDDFEAGSYTLTAVDCPEPGPNDVCEDAIDLREQNLQIFDVDLCNFQHDYTTPPEGCTGFEAFGADAVYKIQLGAGERLEVTESGLHDMVLYLVTDCSDIAGTCVAGADDGLDGVAETLDFTATFAGMYYLMVDGYTGCSPVTVTIIAPVEAEGATWGSLKTMYR